MAEKKESSSEKTTKKTAVKKTAAPKKKAVTAKTTKAKSASEVKKAAKAATEAAVSALAAASDSPKKTAKSAAAKRKTATKKATEENPQEKGFSVSTPSAPAAKPVQVKAQGVTRISTPPRVKQELKKATQEVSVSISEQQSPLSPNSSKGRNERKQSNNRPSQREESESSPFSTPETVGGLDTNNKRNKRRRNRNRNGKGDNQVPINNNHETKVNPDELSKKAWKIFLGEVNEDGLALMDDNSTREVAKRSFRVAEIFLQEEMRRKNSSRHNYAQSSVEQHIEETSTPLSLEELDEESIIEDEDIVPVPDDLLM